MSQAPKTGRPREDGARRRVITIRLSDDDLELIEQAASKTGESRTRYIRDAAVVIACEELGFDPIDYM